MRNLLRILLLFLVPSSGADLAYCSVEEIQDSLKAVFRMGSSAFVSGSEDKPEGFDVEMVERFVAWNDRRAGRVTTYLRAFVGDMNALLRAAEQGKCDMAIGSVTATVERDQRVDFSDPYLPVRLVLIAPPGNLPGGGYASALAGKKVGAIVRSTGAGRVKELENEVSNLVTRTDFPSNEELFEAVLGEPPQIDAAVTDITHYWDLKKNEEVVLVAPMGPEQGLAFVFPEGSPLRERVNEFLEEFLHSQSYFALVRRYFGQEATGMIRATRKK